MKVNSVKLQRKKNPLKQILIEVSYLLGLILFYSFGYLVKFVSETPFIHRFLKPHDLATFVLNISVPVVGTLARSLFGIFVLAFCMITLMIALGVAMIVISILWSIVGYLYSIYLYIPSSYLPLSDQEVSAMGIKDGMGYTKAILKLSCKGWSTFFSDKILQRNLEDDNIYNYFSKKYLKVGETFVTDKQTGMLRTYRTNFTYVSSFILSMFSEEEIETHKETFLDRIKSLFKVEGTNSIILIQKNEDRSFMLVKNLESGDYYLHFNYATFGSRGIKEYSHIANEAFYIGNDYEKALKVYSHYLAHWVENDYEVLMLANQTNPYKTVDDMLNGMLSAKYFLEVKKPD